jgi:hypothetical protein
MNADGIMSKTEVVAFLDDYRRAESFGAKLFQAWVATCRTDSLRGALRMMERRERSHADLLAQRVKELGGSTGSEVGSMAAEFLAYLSAPDKTDGEKLREFMRLAPPDEVIDRLNKQAARLAADPESQALVRAIIDDERSTLWALREAAAASAIAA